MITKQDIQKILELLKKQAARDSSFPATKTLDAESSVPVLANGANKVISYTDLLKSIAGDLSVSDIRINSSKIPKDNLADALEYLLTNHGNGNTPTWTESMYCNYHYTVGGIDPGTVEAALNMLFSIIFGYDRNGFPTRATNAQIDLILIDAQNITI